MNYFKKLRLRWTLWSLEAKELELLKITGAKPSHRLNRIRKSIERAKKALEYEGVLMDALTKDQERYIDLDGSNARSCNEWARIDSNDGFVIRCYPHLKDQRYSSTVNEQRLYLLMEIFEGKHNDFLQSIIDRSKDK